MVTKTRCFRELVSFELMGFVRCWRWSSNSSPRRREKPMAQRDDPTTWCAQPACRRYRRHFH